MCQEDKGEGDEYCHSITFKTDASTDNCVFNYFVQDAPDAIIAADDAFVSAPRLCPSGNKIFPIVDVALDS